MKTNDLYKVLSVDFFEGQKVVSKVFINEAHPIFNGHFPDNPVMPGVCMIQIFKDTLEHSVNKKFQLYSVDNIKFKSIVNPKINAELEVMIQFVTLENGYQLNGSITANGNMFVKISNAIYH
jgi:3-hydroxyacyl-[acyl-carrier-protein] dehydratase